MKFADPEIQKIVQKMTNWQRNQWARAKYPVDRKKGLKVLRRFTQLRRR